MVKPSNKLQAVIQDLGGSELKEAVCAVQLLKRPEMTYKVLAMLYPTPYEVPEDVAEQVEIQVKYEGYISKQLQQVDRMKRMDQKRIPEDLDYTAINGLATEAKQKLNKVRPISVGQASRVSGVNPSDISILLVYLEHGKLAKAVE